MRTWLKRVAVGALILEAVWVNTVLAGLYLQAAGDNQMEHGRLPQALRTYRLTLYLLPYTQHPRANVAMCLATLGRKEDAIAIFRGVVDKEPGNGAYRWRLASLLLEVGRLDEAIERCDPGRYKGPNSGYLWSVLARALRKKGRASEAVGAFQRENAQLRYDPFARDFAGALFESGRAADAEAVEKAAAILSPAGKGAAAGEKSGGEGK